MSYSSSLLSATTCGPLTLSFRLRPFLISMFTYKTAEKRTATIPKWMLTQMGFDRIGNAKDADLTKALKWATSNASIYRKKIDAAIEKGERTVKAGGKSADMSISDATLRAKQYEAFATAIKKEQAERKTVSTDVVYQRSEEHTSELQSRI